MSDQLHFFFFPMMAHGHMIPTLDMAKLVASRGVKATIITTPLNESVFSKAIQRNKNLGIEIDIRLIKFQTVEHGLPEECERLDLIPSDDLLLNFFKATAMMQEPLEQLIQESRPNCLVSDIFFPWTTDTAAKFNIPRLAIHGTSFFALCVGESIRHHKPFKNVSSDSETFVLPNLPHQIKLTRSQLSPFDRIEEEKNIPLMVKAVRESGLKGNGVIFNSFYELEQDYVELYTKVLGRKAWAIGPVSLCNRDIEDKTERGKKSSIDKHDCMKWLDSKKSSSVVYICFGSIANFTILQMRELAMGIEASGQEFIWVVRTAKEEENNEDWLPIGFEERTKEKGLIIRGWAPQVLILDHESVGAFVTHCGWNSTLEGISAGVSMVAWPVFAEQFFNEKLVTEVLRTGVGVGSVKWQKTYSEGVKKEAIAKAIKRVMVGEEAEGFRSRAKAYKEMARKAVEIEGSSYSNLTTLLEDISTFSSISD
ncbi:PREDICTED: scopoletin glucosyltransferase-like [Nicotiana attenuata]|uniref:Scopoletin glucosyltransferase n=1 Tax=Nicotiana attenuata TaxID=49451 RepID=A0A1J6JUZ8_NICAT|nr:PREDICTED: scopoletin glucosyltransferase-like [Nicotiana attenuata]AQQ16719.1 UDP-glycosyltransferase g38353 [Nicotiana attenuata]OIT20300.1 scopoletin glucosyltransferase [Nicotiana attenuata]